MMTDVEAISEAAESMLGSSTWSDGVFTAGSCAIKVSDDQVTRDGEGMETAMCSFVELRRKPKSLR